MVLTRRLAGLLLAFGVFQWLVWPRFARVVWSDERSFDSGPTAYLVVHLALVAASLALGTALIVLGVLGWRRAHITTPS